MGRSGTAEPNVSKRTEVEEIPLLKAISVVSILMRPDTGSVSKYMPLLAKRLQIKETAVRYVWLHRNEILQKLGNGVPYNRRITLIKSWMHSFLYGLVGPKRRKIDYSVIGVIANKWVSRCHSQENDSHDSSKFKIQSVRSMMECLQQQRKTYLPKKITLKKLNQQLKTYVQQYRKKVQKLVRKPGEPKIRATKTIRRVPEPTLRRKSRYNRGSYGVIEMERLIYDSFSILLERFYVPDRMITEIGRHFVPNLRLKWKPYIWKHVGSSKFIKLFRKKYNLATDVDDSHKLCPYYIPMLLMNIFKVRKPVPLPTPDETDNIHEYLKYEDSLEEVEAGRISPTLESLKCDSLTDQTVNRKLRNRVTCRRSEKKVSKRHGKLWRDIVRWSQEQHKPNEETTSLISDLVSKSLVDELTRTDELETMYSVLEEDTLLESTNPEMDMENVCNIETVLPSISIPSEDLDFNLYNLDNEDAIPEAFADLELVPFI